MRVAYERYGDRDVTKWAKITILCGVAWVAIAIDRIFFHVDQPLGWVTLIIAGGYLLGGAVRLYRERSG